MKPIAKFGAGVLTGATAAFVWFALQLESVPAGHNLSGDAGAAAIDEPRAGAIDPGDRLDAVEQRQVSDQAFFDPAGFLVHAESADSIVNLVPGLEILIASEPERVWSIASRFYGSGSTEVDELYLRAIRGMVGRDPIGAIARVQSEAVGPKRDAILGAIGEAYASINPDAALQWASSVTPPAPDAIGSVLTTVARSDLLQAHSLMSQVEDSLALPDVLASRMAFAAINGRQDTATLATELAVRDEQNATAILGTLMQEWTLQEPDSAVTWMNENESFLTDELTRSTVYYLAFEDVAHAAALTGRVPASAQQQWLEEVAHRYGQFDIEAALQWLPQYADRNGYADILNSTLIGAAMMSQQSPEPVARFIAAGNSNVSEEAIVRTGYSYADYDPEGAARWSVGLTDRQQAAWAAAAVADSWAASDGPAAQRWVMEQPSGEFRDELLGSILIGGVFYDDLDRRALVEGFSSPAAAQESIHQFIIRDVINRRNVTPESEEQVDWMLERLTDPELRQQAEQRIAENR